MSKVKAEKINTGITQNERNFVSHELAKVLADTYRLSLKTQNVHWNVKGPLFHTVHVMTESQYGELAGAVDEIAERIRALGYRAPGSLAEFLELSSISDLKPGLDGKSMVKALVSDHEALTRSLRAAQEHAAEAGDEVSADLLTERMSSHEKTAWMLRSLVS